MKKIITLTIILSLFTFLLNAQQPCLPNGIVFTSQAQIDNFGQQYNCDEIQGNVIINEAVPNNITNLNGLSQLTKIDGYLSIKHNSHLEYLTGLDNLTEIGDFLSIYQNDYLKHINALSNVTSIGSFIIIDDNDVLMKITGLSGLDQINGYLKIKKNPDLINLEGLDNVTTITGELQINNNSGLTDMAGLDNLTSIGSNLNISYNSNLANLAGLENLNTIGGYLNFYSNNNLSDITALSGMTAIDGDITVALCNNLASLSGLENINPATINSSSPGYDDLNFHNNSSLSECEVLSVCEVLNNGGTTNIHDNASGCNSEAEVTQACTPPECTNLTDPTDGETEVPVNTSLNWAVSSNADGYRLCVGYSQNCDIFNGDVGNTTTWTPPTDFYCDTTVYVLIKPYNNAPYNINCTYESFSTEFVVASAGDDVEICNGSSTQLQASGGMTYSWYPVEGLDDPYIADPVASPGYTITYTVTVSNDNGCNDTDAVTVTVNPLPVPNASATDETGNNFEDGTATVNPTGGTPGYSYHWSTGEDSQTITDLAPGIYYVTVTDKKGCEGYDSVNVEEYECPQLLISSTISNVSCNEDCDGSITIDAVTNGVPPFSYDWSNGETTSSITGLCAGYYFVTITDSTNCTIFSDSLIVNQPDALALTETHNDVSCFAQKDGNIDLSVSGGIPDYTYQWNIGAITEDLTGMSAGTYTVTVTDVNNCTATLSVTVNEPPLLTVTVASTDETASGENDGTAQTTVEGGTPPYSYLWSNGETTASVTGLAPGDYSVTVTDANNCQKTGYCIINSYDCNDLTISYDFHNVSCYDQCNGDILITAVTNANEPVTYIWSNGNTTSHAQDLCAGSYSVTITDSTNCSTIASFEITQPDLLYISSIGKQDITNDNPKGSIQIDVAGGVPPYSYRWTGDNGYFSTEEDIDNLDAGCYLIVVADNNKCSTHSDSICIEDNSTAVFDLKNEINLKIYPNPANDILYFKYDKNKIASKDISISLYNMSGTKTEVLIDKFNGNIDINNLKQGVYLLEFKTRENTVFKKIAIIK